MYVAVFLSETQTEDEMTRTDRMKERPCLSSVGVGHRRTESAQNFHQQAQGVLLSPVAHEYQKNRTVCFYVLVDIMNMDMMISHQMKCTPEPCFHSLGFITIQ